MISIRDDEFGSAPESGASTNLGIARSSNSPSLRRICGTRYLVLLQPISNPRPIAKAETFANFLVDFELGQPGEDIMRESPIDQSRRLSISAITRKSRHPLDSAISLG
ncbi:MAG: hypothetical protein IT434_02090 [Phycisphaerales bacterium]|nr:hypothetical protein [Phycisphaerales bacterium]